MVRLISKCTSLRSEYVNSGDKNLRRYGKPHKRIRRRLVILNNNRFRVAIVSGSKKFKKWEGPELSISELTPKHKFYKSVNIEDMKYNEQKLR